MGETAKQNAKKNGLAAAANIPEIQPITEIVLRSGTKAVCIRPKGKHVMEAQRLMDGDAEKMLPALISICTTLDGERKPMEYYDEMDAGDFMTLMGHYGPAFM